MVNKLMNILIIFVFLFSILFFCVQTQVNDYNQTKGSTSSSEYNAGTGDISTEI